MVLATIGTLSNSDQRAASHAAAPHCAADRQAAGFNSLGSLQLIDIPLVLHPIGAEGGPLARPWPLVGSKL